MYHLKCFGLAGSPGKYHGRYKNYVSLGHSDSSRQGWLQAQDAVGSIRDMSSVVHRGDGQ